MVTVLVPDVIVIGGGMASAYDILHAPLLAAVRSRAPLVPSDEIRIVAAELGTAAGAIGAALAGAGVVDPWRDREVSRPDPCYRRSGFISWHTLDDRSATKSEIVQHLPDAARGHPQDHGLYITCDAFATGDRTCTRHCQAADRRIAGPKRRSVYRSEELR